MTITTLPPRKRRTHRELRAAAITAGIHPVLAETTRYSDLMALIAAAPQLALVVDADLPDSPRLGIPLTPLQRMQNSGMTYDEIASVLTFTRGIHTESEWVSADEYTPWDEFDGPGAA